MHGRISGELVYAAREVLTNGAEKVTVSVERDHDADVAEHVLDELWVRAGADGDYGRRVP